MRGGFSRLIHALDGREFREIVEEKFSIQLGGRPTMFTVRGYCRLNDGKIHTDTESKIITVLLYMNRAWAPADGRLRLLRSADDVAIEIPTKLRHNVGLSALQLLVPRALAL
jgi:SM-20-related protein